MKLRYTHLYLVGSFLAATSHAQAIWPQETRFVYGPGTATDGLGEGVALDGDIALLGAPAVGRANFSAGYVIAATYENGAWTFQQKLEATEGQLDDQFGFAIALDGAYAVVGAPEASFQGDETGAAYLFTLDGGTWSQIDQLLPVDDEGGLAFGTSVAAYGTTLLVGAPDINIGHLQTGEAYVYELDGDAVASMQRLQFGDFSFVAAFGESVDLGEDLAVIGAPNRGLGGQNFGSVFLYERGDTEWEFKQELQADDQQAQDVFGSSVAVDGDWLIVGAPREDDGASNAGAAYLFRRSPNGTWTQFQRIKAPTPFAQDLFGESVDVSGSVAIVGSSRHDGQGSGSGTAYVFRFNGSEWVFEEQLFASDAGIGDDFGRSIAIDGEVIVAGAAGANGDDAEESVGTAYFYRKDPLATSIETSPEEIALFDVAMYPNPGAGAIQLQMSVATPDPLHIDVFDLLGRHVFSEEAVRSAGSESVRTAIDARTWSPGLYLVRITAGQTQKVFPLTVLH